MSHAKNRLRTLGLGFIAVLGLTAFMASSAQAQLALKPHLWLINGSELTGHATVNAKVHSLGLFLVPTLAGGFEVDCKEVTLPEGLLLGSALPEPGTAHAVIHFTQCLTYIAGKHEDACDPLKELVEAKTLVLPILHSGVVKLLFSPPTGSTQFALISVDEECSLPVKNKVTGKLLASCLNESNLVLLDCLHSQTLPLLKQFTGLAEHALSYGTHAATLDGVVDIFVTSPVGATLAAHAHHPAVP